MFDVVYNGKVCDVQVAKCNAQGARCKVLPLWLASAFAQYANNNTALFAIDLSLGSACDCHRTSAPNLT